MSIPFQFKLVQYLSTSCKIRKVWKSHNNVDIFIIQLKRLNVFAYMNNL
jgi:hypothetical protein